MAKIKFFQDQHINFTITHKANKEYSCVDEDEGHYYIRPEFCPSDEDWSTKLCKDGEGKIFEVIK